MVSDVSAVTQRGELQGFGGWGGRDGSRRGLKISAGGATLCPLESARNIAKNGQG